MGATIHTTSVSHDVKRITHNEVACIYCGLPTPVPVSGSGQLASHATPRTSIIRCEVCGKEAPYRARDIVESGTNR
jgi:hypothetical protein